MPALTQTLAVHRPNTSRTLFVMCLAGLVGHCSAGLARSDEPATKKLVRTGEKGSHAPIGANLTKQVLEDARLKPLRLLENAYHPWTPPVTRSEWEMQASDLRKQVLVGCGLWPMPEKTPLDPVIHGKVDRGDYTIEKVFFASRPGHYVTGNLYRPKAKQKAVEGAAEEKFAGVLCPYGHWPDGRFYDAGHAEALKQVEIGAEKHYAGARYPLQARMVQLARMGCVVFHYDMVGRADSGVVEHALGFNDLEATLRLQSPMGLQTWNSLRALDFLTSLPDVDTTRLGVTGASGGGTQTFMLCAIDPRPTVAFPAVMVSTAMQGGCVCENTHFLRIGINNVTLAALFAPKPMAMSGAHDWTIDIETKGLPELKQVYALYNHPELVMAKAWPEFQHNYNQPARELMYGWFNEYLKLGQTAPGVEQDFWPLTPAELSVFDEAHPRPQETLTAAALRERLTEEARNQFEAVVPKSADDFAKYQEVIGPAARVMLGIDHSRVTQMDFHSRPTKQDEKLFASEGVLKRPVAKEYVSWSSLSRHEGNHVDLASPVDKSGKGTTVWWFDPKGRSHLFDAEGKPDPQVQRLVDAGFRVASADLFLTGDFLAQEDPAKAFSYQVNDKFPGYTFGYNRPILAERVRDIVWIVDHHPASMNAPKWLVGTAEAGLWVLAARSLLREKRPDLHTLADLKGFAFSKVTDLQDPNMLPGALKYGGLSGLAALGGPSSLKLFGVTDANRDELKLLEHLAPLQHADLALSPTALTREQVVDLILQQK